MLAPIVKCVTNGFPKYNLIQTSFDFLCQFGWIGSVYGNAFLSLKRQCELQKTNGSLACAGIFQMHLVAYVVVLSISRVIRCEGGYSSFEFGEKCRVGG